MKYDKKLNYCVIINNSIITSLDICSSMLYTIHAVGVHVASLRLCLLQSAWKDKHTSDSVMNTHI